MNIKLIKCPICTIGFLKQGLSNHIINRAEGEAYRTMNNLLSSNHRGKIVASSAVLLRNMPHLRFFRQNLKDKKHFIYEK